MADFKSLLSRTERLGANHGYLFTNVRATASCFAKCHEVLVKHKEDVTDSRLESANLWDARKLDALLSVHQSIAFRYFSDLWPPPYFAEDSIGASDRLDELEYPVVSLARSLNPQPHKEVVRAIARLFMARDYLGVLEQSSSILGAKQRILSEHDQVRLLTLQAGAYRWLDRFQEALEAIQAANRLDDKDAAGAFNYALCLRDVGRLEDAGKVMTKHAGKDERGLYRFGRGIVLADSGRYADARQELELALKTRSTDSDFWHVQAFVNSRLGRHDDAREQCKKALELSDEHPVYLCQRGTLELRSAIDRRGRLDGRAIQRALRFLERADANLKSAQGTRFAYTTRLNLAIGSHLAKQDDRALSLLEVLAEAKFNEPTVWACMAECFLAQGNWRSAEESYRRAEELGETHSALRNNRAVALLELGGKKRQREAIKVLASVDDGEPAAGAAQINMAQCLIEIGQATDALQAVQKALMFGVRSWKSLYLRARALILLDRKDEAISTAIRCVGESNQGVAHAFLVQLLQQHHPRLLRNTIDGLAADLLMFRANKAAADDFQRRVIEEIEQYANTLSLQRDGIAQSAQLASSYASCAERWATTVQLRRTLDVIRARDRYGSPASQELVAKYVCGLVGVELDIEEQSSMGRSDRGSGKDHARLATRVGVPVTITVPAHALLGREDTWTEATPEAGLLGLDLRLKAAAANLSRGFTELRCLADCSIDRHEHQIRAALHVLRQCDGQAILADEVGLGKTIEAGLIVAEYLVRGMAENVLVIAPSSLVAQWQAEMSQKFGLRFERWTPEWTEDQFHSHKLVIASLHSLRTPKNRHLFDETSWDIMVVDEAHHVRRPRSAGWRLINGIRTSKRLLLTATPIQNSLRDLHSLVSLAKPGALGTWTSFRERFVPRSDQSYRAVKNVASLRRMLVSVLVRTQRSETPLVLAERKAFTRKVELPENWRAIYDEVSAFARGRLRRATAGRRDLSLYTLQRQLCSASAAAAPTLLRMATRPRTRRETREKLQGLAERCFGLGVSPKCRALRSLLTHMGDEKVIVYTEFQRAAEEIGEYIGAKGWDVVLLHNAKSADEAVQRFAQSANVLVSTGVGSEGLNLQFCRNVVNYDFPWNPVRIEQRIGRVHRIGQRQTVHVYNFIAEDTIEEYVADVLEQKLRLFELLIGEVESVLGMLPDQQSVEAVVHEALTTAKSENELRSMLDNYGERLEGARAQWEWGRGMSSSIGVSLVTEGYETRSL